MGFSGAQIPSFPEPDIDLALKYKVLQVSQLKGVCTVVGSSLLAPKRSPGMHLLFSLVGTYPAGGEVSGLSAKLIDLGFRDIGTFLCLLELMLSFTEFGEVSIGLFILKPKSPGR